MNLNTTGLFDLSHTLAGDYLARFEYPWQALDGIKDLILTLGPTLGDEYEELGSQIWVHQTAQIAHSAFWARPASSAPTPRCATAPSSGAPPWWGQTAWWATRWS